MVLWGFKLQNNVPQSSIKAIEGPVVAWLKIWCVAFRVSGLPVEIRDSNLYPYMWPIILQKLPCFSIFPL